MSRSILRPQWRIVFTTFKKCNQCNGTGEAFAFGKALIGFPCPHCKKAGGKDIVQVLSIRREVELQQQSMRSRARKVLNV